MRYIEALELKNKVNCIEALATSFNSPRRTTPLATLESTVLCMIKVNKGAPETKHFCYIIDGSNCPLGLKPKP
jgi:hypothetical protein